MMNQDKKSMDDLLAEIEVLKQKASISERFNNSIIDSASDGIITVTADGTIKSWNIAAKKMFEYDTDEIINCNISKIITNTYIETKDTEKSKRLINLWLRNNMGTTTELKGTKKDGSEFSIELSTSTWESNHTVYITGIIRDISERKKSLSELQKLNQALKKSKEIVFMTDTNGVFTYVNEQFTKIYGFEPFEVIGIKTPRILKSPQNTRDFSAFWRSLVNKQHIPTIQYTNIGKDGKIRHVEGSADPILSDDDEILGYLGIQRDISERLLVLNDLKEALANAKESDRLKAEFLATMSHELRTPLNSIIGLSSLIDEETPLTDILEFSKIINTSGEQLLDIVESLFDISLIESGQLKVINKELKLESVLLDIDHSMRMEQQKLNKEHVNLNLIISTENKNLFINADSHKLTRILKSLLRNAIRFTEEGYINYGYNLYQHDGKTVVKFFIEDTGIGIHEENQNLIFELFRQVDGSFNRQYEGLGLGLTIAKKLTMLLGGNIWVESVLGKGSTFFFTLPLENGNRLEIPETEIILKSDNVLSGKLVLIVEDDASNYEYLKTVLQLNHIRYLWAKNGDIAIKCCEENQNIDLILMDINMPVLNGFEAIKRIKTLKPKLPIIAQTAYAFDNEKYKILESGCDDYISKPIKVDALIAIIEKYLIK